MEWPWGWLSLFLLCSALSFYWGEAKVSPLHADLDSELEMVIVTFVGSFGYEVLRSSWVD